MGKIIIFCEKKKNFKFQAENRNASFPTWFCIGSISQLFNG